jgi:hypothetical protein
MAWSTLKGRSAPLFYALAATSLILAHASAHAQWDCAAEAGIRRAQAREFAPAGKTLVQEQGWLPGVGMLARFRMQDWTFGVSGETWRADIDYDGSLQNGVAFTTRTATRQNRVSLDVTRAVTATTRLVGGIEYDRWHRGIRGQNGIAGLDEIYASWRLLAGAEAALLAAPVLRITGKALLVLAGAESVTVRFDKQLFDDARLRTKPATGVRLGLALQPMAWPNTSLLLDADWLRTRRSDDEPLRRNGIAAGTLAQPEHERSAFSARLQYRF